MISEAQVNYITDVLGVNQILCPVETSIGHKTPPETQLHVTTRVADEPQLVKNAVQLQPKFKNIQWEGELGAPLIVLTSPDQQDASVDLLKKMMAAAEFNSFLWIKAGQDSASELKKILKMAFGSVGLIFGRSPAENLNAARATGQKLKPGEMICLENKQWMLTYSIETMIAGQFDVSNKNLVMYKRQVWSHIKKFKSIANVIEKNA